MRQSRAQIINGKCENCGEPVVYKKNPSFIGRKRVFCKKDGDTGKSECFLEYFKKHRKGFEMMDNFS